MYYFESYHAKSRIRKVHPAVKTGIFVIYTSIALMSKSFWLSGILTTLFFGVNCYTSKISFFKQIRLIAIPSTFIFLGSISIMVEFSSVTTLQQISLFGYTPAINNSGFITGCHLFVRSLSAIIILYFLILNTSISDIIIVLRKLKVPELLLEIMSLVYRNIFIFMDTSNSIFISQKSRLGYHNTKSMLHSASQLGGRMFVLAGVRVDNLYKSMESRCYNGKISTLHDNWQVPVKLIAASLGIAVLFILALFFIK